MAWSLTAEGAQLTVINTEHTLQDITSPALKTFQLQVDTNPMANDDVVELRIYQKVKVSGTLRVAWIQVLADAQGADNAVFITIPFVGSNNIKFTLKQTAGSVRTFNWEVLELA